MSHLPPISIELFLEPGDRFDYAEDVAAALPDHPLEVSEEALEVHGYKIFVGVVAVFPPPLTSEEHRRQREISTDIAIHRAMEKEPPGALDDFLVRAEELMPESSLDELVLQAETFYEHQLGYRPVDAKSFVDQITVGTCLENLSRDARRLRDIEPADSSCDVVDELEQIHRHAWRLTAALGLPLDTVEATVIGQITRALSPSLTQLPSLHHDDGRRLVAIAQQLDAYRSDLRDGDHGHAHLGEIRQTMEELFAEAEALYRQEGFDAKAAALLARAPRLLRNQ